jgi:cobalamin transport system permease protein
MSRYQAILITLAVLALVVLAICPFCGMTDISFSSIWDDPAEGPAARIFWQLRLPRTMVAFVAGAGLALAGMAMQSVFRNPLATPYTLGIASGASLGAVVAMRFGSILAIGHFSTISVGAFSGAIATVALVYGLARMRREFSITALLLAGVALSFFFSSVILLLQYLGNPNDTYRMIRWMIGGLDRIVGFGDLAAVALPVGIGIVVLAMFRNELNLLATGTTLAAARGVEVQRTQKILLLAASLIVGGVVSICGPISFIGLIVPHLVRLLIGSDHRQLLPTTLLAGGVFLVICDTFARTIIAPVELPVGILTALLGGPFFLGLLVFGHLNDN